MSAPLFEATCGATWPSKRRDITLSTRGWELYHTNKSGAPNEMRTFTQHVNHSKMMSAIPEVFLGLNAIDLLLPGPLCVQLKATNITTTGMDIQFSTFNSTCVWSAGASWFAFVPHEGGPVFHTGKVQCDPSVAGYCLHLPGQPGAPQIFEYYVPFATPFTRDQPPPTVLTVISGFNAPARGMNGSIPLRLRVAAPEVSHDHFKLQVMTWEDSLVNDVTVSWLAYSVPIGSPFTGCIASQVQPCMNNSPNFAVAAGKGPRDFVQKITWPEFPDVPAVGTWLSGMEIQTRTDVRLKAVEKARTRCGCDLVFGTWDNTLVGGGDITWFAFIDTLPAAGAAPSGMRDSSGRRFNFAPEPSAPSAPSAPFGMPSAPSAPMAPMGMGMPGADGVESGMECVVCYERAKDTLIQPCNHICCCSQCAAKLSPNICPVCRSPIEGKVKIFFS